MTNIIEQEITIAAPAAVVWEVITKPEHISQWFSESAELDLQPNGKGLLSWRQLGEAPLEVVAVDEPHLFSFFWVAPDEETQRNGDRTLIEFKLSEEGQTTRLRVTESGFENLDCTDAERSKLIAKHTPGWQSILANLQQYATSYAGQK